MPNYLDNLAYITQKDTEILKEKEAGYKGSWKKRGGVGAFMMLARKWDRLETFLVDYGFDVFMAIDKDVRKETVLEDIRDLRRYLMLVEAEMIDRQSSAAYPLYHTQQS